MKWKRNEITGVPRMMNSIEAPGTITICDITDGIMTNINLKRLEPSEGERQLGIVMPLDGSFKQEQLVRWDKSKDLGQRIYRAPLQPYEAILVYKMYYIPKVAYPVSLTKFSKKECDAIQSQFYRYALPKMGLNRHTPRALIFGPMLLGGFQLYDLLRSTTPALHQNNATYTKT